MKKVLIIGKAPKLEEEVAFYNSLTNICKEYGLDIIGNPVEGGAESFADYADLFNAIEEADIVIAESSNESIEVGMQLKEADLLGKPVIAIVNNTATIPSVIESIPNIGEVIFYDSVEDLRDGLVRNIAVIE